MTKASNKIDSIVAVDTGGTFTDFYWRSGKAIRTHKVLSTPHNPAEAICRGLADLGIKSGVIIHGSTVATNALLEHKGARIALITTEGFEDVIEIGRQNRPELYNIFVERATPLVTRRHRFGIRERIDSRGETIIPLQKKDLTKLRDRLKRIHFEAIAICTLNAYANPRHEQLIGRALNALKIPLSLSSEICPEYREYERMSTTCTNAYVTPIMSRYLQQLSDNLSHPIRVMQSNGGSLSLQEASREAVRTLLSGPAGGALGALRAAQQSGYRRLLALDMGGTSTDVTVIDKAIELTSEAVVSAYPVKSPMIHIHTIGAGGGSIAGRDPGGALKVGPQSAGAAPGPICYGRGGRNVTITDAHLWLGRLHVDHFLGGTMPLHNAPLKPAMQKLARQLKLSADETAAGIIEVANAHMSRALRVISLERGYDPREFTLVAFGGAGGLHACELADRLEIPRVLIPAEPGVLSAYGMAHADWTRDYVQTVLIRETKLTKRRMEAAFHQLRSKASREARREGFPKSRLRFKAEVDLRYRGQSYELRVPYNHHMRHQFEQQHLKTYGYKHDNEEVEVVNVRLQVRAPQQHPTDRISTQRTSGRQRLLAVNVQTLYWNNQQYRLNVYQRTALQAGSRVTGPGLITEYSGTTFVPPGWSASCDRVGNLLMTP